MITRQRAPVYGAGRSRLEERAAEKHSILSGLMLIGITLFMVVAPFHAALFYGYTVQYEVNIHSAVMLSGVLLLLLSFYAFYHWRFQQMRDWLALAVWTIPLSYALSSISAASSHFSANMIEMNMMYAAFFAIAVFLAANKSSAGILQQGIVFSGYIIVVYCFMNMFGNAYYRDAVMLTDQGLRLTSVFQYANAYAAYLLALLLSCIWTFMNTRKPYLMLLHGIMLLPIMLSFLLTLSRGGIVVLPLILLAILPFFTLIRQIAFFVYLAIVTAGSLLILEPIRSKAEAIVRRVVSSAEPEQQRIGFFTPDSISGWLLLGGVSLLTALLLVCLHYWLVPRTEKRYADKLDKRFMPLLLPALMIAACILGAAVLSGNTPLTKLLPDSLQQRLSSINFQQHSVLERFTMYKDSLKIASDYPVTGAGGGAWISMYQKYQNNPYVVKQVHNFFLQYLIETGLVGLLCLVGLLGCVLYGYIRHYFRSRQEDRASHHIFYIVVVSILIHSMLDFEMSYVYLASLVFLCLGGMASQADKPMALFKPDSAGSKRIRWAVPVLIGVASVYLFYSAAVQLKSNQLFIQANELVRASSKPSFDEVMEPLDAALKYAPGHPDYLNFKIQLLHQAYNQTKEASFEQEANRSLALLDQYEPYDKERLETEYDQYVQSGRLDEALKVALRSLELNPWGVSVYKERPNWYERAIALCYELGSRARAANQTDSANAHWSRAYSLYDTVTAKTESLKLLPKGQMQGEPFGVTPVMSLFIGQAKFAHKDYAGAADALGLNVSADYGIEINRMIARWYLAALQMKGESDAAVYAQLTTKFPEEKESIAALAALTAGQAK
ncbi:O-antigen ligase domain-containing protein [Paenibacillus sp. H1-7]|uniref:O-antigen ligase family protein n=1 Tax=Paenibacillus sp. H1-7 TaxID=2282849 RepID=UPI001EF87CEE|nr:O-antigen ligase family protein [Paenibacillus sp. H1-7]ULL18730.1 O-antigen ligase domain-containing protein [Paenibacillus sp. H1-7]